MPPALGDVAPTVSCRSSPSSLSPVPPPQRRLQRWPNSRVLGALPGLSVLICLLAKVSRSTARYLRVLGGRSSPTPCPPHPSVPTEQPRCQWLGPLPGASEVVAERPSLQTCVAVARAGPARWVKDVEERRRKVEASALLRMAGECGWRGAGPPFDLAL